MTDAWLGQDLLEWIGLVTGILYVGLAIHEKPVAWFFGLCSSACLAWKSLADYKLVADGILQLVYVGMSLAGLASWRRTVDGAMSRPIRTFRIMIHAGGIAACLGFAFPLSAGLIRFAGARYGYPDTVLMLLSLWATGLLIRKDLHQWIYWMVINAGYVALYWISHAWLFAFLFGLYGLASVWGWQRWSRRYAGQTAILPHS